MAVMNRYTVGSTTVPRGVRKVNEETVQEGRALIITDNNEDNYNWEEIPDGSLKVDVNSGIILVKLKGESTWVPSNVRLDIPRDSEGNVIYDTNNTEYGHTISIAKDAVLTRENYVILDVDVEGNKFYYEDENGQRWTGEKSNRGYHFELHKGHYAPGRNMIDILIDDCLYRSAASGGIIEQSETRFIIVEELVAGMEITVRYYQLVRIGNPYPRFFLRRGEYTEDGIDTNGEPEAAEVGDVWVDFSRDPSDPDGYLGEMINSEDMIPWNRIYGYPTTVRDAKVSGLMTDAVAEGHRHSVSDVDGLSSLIASSVSSVAHASRADVATSALNASNADKLQNCTIGTGAGCVVQVQTNGKIANSVLPVHTHNISSLYMDDGKSLAQGIVDYVQGALSGAFVRGMIMPFWGNTIPSGWAECNGQNGTPDLRDRFVMGAGSRFGVGAYPGAGLPNINGQFAAVRTGGGDPSYVANGVFWEEGRYCANPKKGAGDDWGTYYGFNAARCSGVYGASDTVQPPACVMRYIMKL